MLIYAVIRETLKNQRVRVKNVAITAFAEIAGFLKKGRKKDAHKKARRNNPPGLFAYVRGADHVDRLRPTLSVLLKVLDAHFMSSDLFLEFVDLFSMLGDTAVQLVDAGFEVVDRCLQLCDVSIQI